MKVRLLGSLITAVIYGLITTGVTYVIFGDFNIWRSLIAILYFFIIYVIFWNKIPDGIKVDW